MDGSFKIDIVFKIYLIYYLQQERSVDENVTISHSSVVRASSRYLYLCHYISYASVGEITENTLTFKTSAFLQNAVSVLSLRPWHAICGVSNFCFHAKFLLHVALLNFSSQVVWIWPMILSPSILGVFITSSDVPREFWPLGTTWLWHEKAVSTYWPS